MAISNPPIVFKSSKSGLVIQINQKQEMETVKDLLKAKISENQDFLQGVQFSHIQSKYLKNPQILELQKYLEEAHQVTLKNPLPPSNKRYRIKNLGLKKSNPPERSISIGEMPSLEFAPRFVRQTVRSGTLIESPGDIVVLGDVNPGGQVIAAGNIIVMGAIRGIAHAGSAGDEKAFVAANFLHPIQLRIAHLIAIAPEQSSINQAAGTRIAQIQEGVIVIEEQIFKP